jgi:hypothetical protein
MAEPHPFDGALQRVEQLREYYDAPMEAAVRKDIARITTLRVNGRAAVSAEPGLLDRMTPVGKPPKTAIVVEAEEVYTHCPKAFVRSKLWDPATWPDPAHLPSSAEVSLAHQRNPDLTLEQVKKREREALLYRLD